MYAYYAIGLKKWYIKCMKSKKWCQNVIPRGPGSDSSMGGIFTIIGGRWPSTQMPTLKQMYNRNTKQMDKTPSRMRPHRSWWNLRG